MVATPANSINETTTGLTGFNGTSFTATPTTAHAVLVGGSTSSTITNVGPSATSGQILRSGGSSADPSYSTSTYPATNAINTLLYASSANTMAALSTSNSSVLVTDGSGVPSLSTTIPTVTIANINGPTIINGNVNSDLDFEVYNTNAGASAASRLSLSTGTGNSYILLQLNDNAGSPSLGLYLGSAVSGFTLPNPTYGTTQSASDNSTKLATTAYVDRAAPTGRSVGFASTSSTTATSTTTILATTGTTPTTSNTTQLINLTYTAASTSNYLVFDFSCPLSISSNASCGFFLFSGTTLLSCFPVSETSNTPTQASFRFSMLAASTSSTTYHIYYATTGGTVFILEASAGVPFYNSVTATQITFTVTEYT